MAFHPAAIEGCAAASGADPRRLKLELTESSLVADTKGVETDEQHRFLAMHGCTFYQGYLSGKPVAVAELETLLRAPVTRPGPAVQDGYLVR